MTTTATATGGWQTVALTRVRDDVWEATDVHTCRSVGTVSEWTPGLWQAHRIGHSAESAATLGQAMAKVDWLLCVHAGELADRLTAAPDDRVRLVLADGTVATVDRAETNGLKVTLCLDVCPEAQFDMAHPAPVSTLAMSTEVPAGQDDAPVRRLACVTYFALFALAPACSECNTTPGEVCHPFAAHDFF